MKRVRRLAKWMGYSRAIRIYRSLGFEPPSEILLDNFAGDGNVSIGVGTYGSPRILEYGQPFSVRIGNYCSIADDVEIIAGGYHHTDHVTTFPMHLRGLGEGAENFELRQVQIGHDVWIGRGARILPEVTIGNGAIVGAYSVVAHNVDAYDIVVGNPARPIRKRFSPEIVAALEEIKWWFWPRERIVRELRWLCSSDVKAFIERAQNVDGTSAL